MLYVVLYSDALNYLTVIQLLSKKKVKCYSCNNLKQKFITGSNSFYLKQKSSQELGLWWLLGMCFEKNLVIQYVSVHPNRFHI